MSTSNHEEFIPVHTPWITDREKELVNQALDTGWISSEGPFVGEFEAAMAQRVNRKHGIAVTNGTAALELSVRALDIGPGDEVILPTFTIISCAQAVTNVGATPVTVDCDPQTWNMSTDEVAAAVTPRTKAIMAVHIYGLPVNMDPILEIARKHNLAIIEDAAEAIGQTYNGRPCGSFGDISCLSFYANKHVTTGEGGMILTDDPAVAERCRGLRNLCFQPERRFVHEELGANCRFTNLQAALGLAQLERLEETIAIKRALGLRYRELLCDMEGLQLPERATSYAENCYWVFGVALKDPEIATAPDVIDALMERGVGSRPFFWPMHEQPVFRKAGLFHDCSHPHAERLARSGLYLPSSATLNNSQLERIADALRQALNAIA
jgi:perosamine synthetase